MSSVHRAFSQVAPFKRYVTTAINAQLYKLNVSGVVIDGPVVATAGTVLRDMGQTLISADGITILRKVQVLPVTTGVSNSGVTGYIKLGDASVAGQNIVALN
jgi:hypothetical protein